jgi:hypothetical protein
MREHRRQSGIWLLGNRLDAWAAKALDASRRAAR